MSTSFDEKNTNANDDTKTTIQDDAFQSTSSTTNVPIVRDDVKKEITKKVIHQKLKKMRHLVIPKAIHPSYLDSLFPPLLNLFDPQTVQYNGGIAKIKQWKISCYLEVMEGGIPCTNPHIPLLQLFTPLLEQCNDMFTWWYKQQHSYEKFNGDYQVKRIMTFITRYRPNPGEEALLKHVDGAGKVDGSCVVALPVDRWSDREEVNSFVGHGGGLTFWDGKELVTEEEEERKEEGILEEKKEGEVKQPKRRGCRRYKPKEIQYDTRSGDVAFIDRAVWHQANPITKGTRWALVIFYDVKKVTRADDNGDTLFED